MIHSKFAAILFLLMIFSALNINSQEVIRIDPAVTTEYFSPLAEGISGSMNSGWFQRAPKTTFLGFEMELGFVGMGTFLNRDQSTFSSFTNVKFPESTIDKMVEGMDEGIQGMIKDSLMRNSFLVNISGPTAIGSNTESVQINYPGDTITVMYQGQQRAVIIPAVNLDSKVRGINLPVTPLGTLQLSVGTIAGTKLSFRFTPPIYLGREVGSISNYGIGIQHNPMVWFTKKPVIDLSLAFFMQKLNVGEIYKSTSVQYGIFASKTFGGDMFNVTPYTGLTLDENSSNVRYVYDYTDNFGNSGEIPMELDINSGPAVRFRTGVSFKLSVVNLNLDYGYSKYHSLSAGFGFIF